ncbi:hypothetical protein [Nonomuraea sp. B19D2]|uniref:DUF3885 domain-containing protein n=1 Tax=Nonomuraea sp. B19D2 TaxID=3159561 RepID=UPI0032DAD254
MTEEEVESLTTAWRTRWDRSPIAYQLRGWHADRWVRFEDEEGRVSPDPRHLGAVPWLTIDPGDDSPFEDAQRLYVSMTSFDRQTLDPLLRGVADGEIFDVIIAPLDLRWLYHPYDGGADVVAPTAHDRDVLKNRHADWLSTHPAGL